MKALYFDIIGGIAGDMTVAALLDLGVDFGYLKKELCRLPVRGYALTLAEVARGHGRAKKFDVKITRPLRFSYRQIVRLIKDSGLAQGAKIRALAVYKTLAEAEALVHGHAHADQRFHEVGDLDSVIDIVGTAICLDALGARDILYSVVPVNHSLAPAAMKLLEGKKVLFTGIHFENVTPTGMAVLAALGRQAEEGCRDSYRVVRSGTGGGSMDPVETPNVLRVIELEGGVGLETDDVLVVEANIDDMNPQFFEPAIERLFEAGALDVFVTPVIMKKSRPAFLLTVLSNRDNFDKIMRVVLRDTTAIGARYFPVGRWKLPRKTRSLLWRGRRVRVKVCDAPGGRTRVIPEYDDCRALAAASDESVARIYQEIKKKAEDTWRSQA